jgi:hypothetical protein
MSDNSSRANQPGDADNPPGTWPVDNPMESATAPSDHLTEPVLPSSAAATGLPDQSAATGPPDPIAAEHPLPAGSAADHPFDPQPGHPDAAAAAQAEPDWQQRYERERKRSRLFMVTTALAALLFTGTLAYAVADTGPDAGPSAFAGERFGGGFGPRGGHGGSGGGHGGPRGGYGQGWQDDGAAGYGGDSADDYDDADDDYDSDGVNEDLDGGSGV